MNSDPTKKQAGWLLPPQEKRETTESLKPGLYVISTPIGNMRDITLRALDVLCAVDKIACEDTRVTKKLLQYYGIQKPLLSYNDHSSGKQRGDIVGAIKSGGRIALVSDAGTPLVSDPGYKLVQSLMEEGLYITSLPGASAPLAALQLSGLPSDSFTFAGFLPTKKEARKKALAAWGNTGGTLLFFETANRLLASLEEISHTYGACDVAVVREITKLFEETRAAPVDGLIAHYREQGPPKGEIVIVIGPRPEKVIGPEETQKLLTDALKTMSIKEAAAYVAEQTGQKKKALYDMALQLNQKE